MKHLPESQNFGCLYTPDMFWVTVHSAEAYMESKFVVLNQGCYRAVFADTIW